MGPARYQAAVVGSSGITSSPERTGAATTGASTPMAATRTRTGAGRGAVAASRRASWVASGGRSCTRSSSSPLAAGPDGSTGAGPGTVVGAAVAPGADAVVGAVAG